MKHQNATRRSPAVRLLGWLLIGLPLRYLFGLPLVGSRATDATFTSRGTGWLSANDQRSIAAYFNGGKPMPWQLAAGYELAFWRLVIPGAAYGLWWAWTHYPMATLAGVVIVLGVTLGLLGAAGWLKWARRHHMKEFVRPLARALAPQLQQDEKTPNRWLHVPMNFRDEDAVIKIDLPTTFMAGPDPDEEEGFSLGASKRQVIDTLVCERLKLNRSELTARYVMSGEFPYVEYRHRQRVPDMVNLADVRAALEKAPEASPVLGMGRGRNPISVNIDTDTPHILLSVASGGGKSGQARAVMAQHLAKGGLVVLMDHKRDSHLWLRGHPRVIYVRDFEDIHNIGMLLGEELDRRQRASENGEEVGARLLIVIEERNALMELLPEWWNEQRAAYKAEHREEIRRGDVPDLPAMCPSLRILRSISYMGRSAKVHLFSIAQFADARTMGGPASRENYGARILGRYSSNVWKMLVGTRRAPKASKHIGRFQVVLGGETQVMQGLWLEDDEAREVAWSCFPEGLETTEKPLSWGEFFLPREEDPKVVSGEVIDVVDEATSAREEVGEMTSETTPETGSEEPVKAPSEASESVPVSQASHVPATPGDQGKQGGTVPGTDAHSRKSASASTREKLTLIESPVSLREAVDQGIVSCSLEVLRINRKGRDPEFPQPKGMRGKAMVFDPAELRRWERNRPKAGKTETA